MQKNASYTLMPGGRVPAMNQELCAPVKSHGGGITMTLAALFSLVTEGEFSFFFLSVLLNHKSWSYLLQNRFLLLKLNLTPRTTICGYVLCGSSCLYYRYPQRDYLFIPVQHPTTDEEFAYNRWHRTTSASVEHTFGVWKQRFR